MSQNGDHQDRTWFDKNSKYFGLGGLGLGAIALVLAGLLSLGVVAPSSKLALPCPTVTDGVNGVNGVNGLDGLSAYDLWRNAGHDGTLDDFFAALVGKAGKDGFVGSDGVNGADGATGAVGADGASAYQLWLDAGNAGTQQDFLKALVGPQGETGATGPAGLEGLSAYKLWLLQGNSGDLQAFLNSLVGARGPKGSTGASGSPGPAGSTGPKGDPGDGGSTSQATPVPGPAGSPGPKGDTGETGAAGATGQSAYQLWVANGHPDGTETEFLASLVGKDGICTPGDTGATGPAGPKGDKGDPGSGLPYNASFLDTTTQNNSGGTQLMRYNTADSWNEGITVPSSNPSRITFAHPGVYNIQFSTQFAKTDSGTDFIDVWLRKNGSDVPMSNTELRSWGNDDRLVAAWNFFVEVTKAGDYYEIAWQSLDTDISMLSTTGNGKPGIPSVILTVTQVK